LRSEKITLKSIGNPLGIYVFRAGGGDLRKVGSRHAVRATLPVEGEPLTKLSGHVDRAGGDGRLDAGLGGRDGVLEPAAGGIRGGQGVQRGHIAARGL